MYVVAQIKRLLMSSNSSTVCFGGAEALIGVGVGLGIGVGVGVGSVCLQQIRSNPNNSKDNTEMPKINCFFIIAYIIEPFRSAEAPQQLN